MSSSQSDGDEDGIKLSRAECKAEKTSSETRCGRTCKSEDANFILQTWKEIPASARRSASTEELVKIDGHKYFEGRKLGKVYSFYFLKRCKNVTYSLCSY